MQSPFRDDPRFWTSVGRSADALWTLVIATALVVLLGPYAAVAFVVPILLMVISGRDARASATDSRATFASRDEWRAAERQAVAAALPGAFVRHLRR